MQKTLRILFCCIFALLALEANAAKAPVVHQEQQLDSLTIGTQTYSNVTVTTQTKDYVFILHSRGMLNVKVSELPLEAKQLLGYAPKEPAPTAAAWAQQTLVKLDQQPEVRQIQEKLSLSPDQVKELRSRFNAPLNTSVLIAILGIAFFFYLFFCYCSKLICEKAGHEPGVLIWIPILQMIPLLRAAAMSPLWLLASFIPVLNFVAQIIWCVKISQARGKSFWTAILLILPFTNLFAYLYLAFSSGPESDDDKRIEIMTLEAA